MQLCYELALRYPALTYFIRQFRPFASVPCTRLRQTSRRLQTQPLTLRLMKRSNGFVTASPVKKSKKTRPIVPDYCDVEPRRDEAGDIVWPAPANVMEEARIFIKEWYA